MCPDAVSRRHLRPFLLRRESEETREWITRHSVSIIAPFWLGCNQMPLALRTDATGPVLDTSVPGGITRRHQLSGAALLCFPILSFYYLSIDPETTVISSSFSHN